MPFGKFNIANFKNKVTAISALFALTVTAACNVGDIAGGQGNKVDITKPVIVAMLVPKGGALDAVGRSLEDGGALAMSELNSDEIDLRVYATGGDPGQAVKAAGLAKAAGAQLIIGPLTTAETFAVYRGAGVPILSFSNNAEAVDEDSYILGTSFKLITDRLAKYSKATGASRVSVVYGDDLTGQQGVVSMRDSAKSNGLQIVSENGYPLSVAEINAAAPSIANQIKANQADSVFLTDTPTGGLPIITRALADQGVTSSTSQYLGLASWNVPASSLSLPQLQGGVFTDTAPGPTSAFNARFQAKAGYTPHPLAGIGYDGVAAAIALIKDARKSGDNTPFGSRDIQSISFAGAYGPVEFSKDNRAIRDLVVLQVQNGAVRQVSGPSN